jgi:hypothetical protein
VIGRDVPLPSNKLSSNNMKCELLVGVKTGNMENLFRRFCTDVTFAKVICLALLFRNPHQGTQQ